MRGHLDTNMTEGGPGEETERLALHKERREASGETNPADILISDLQPEIRTVRNKLLLNSRSVVLGYRSPGKLPQELSQQGP